MLKIENTKLVDTGYQIVQHEQVRLLSSFLLPSVLTNGLKS